VVVVHPARNHISITSAAESPAFFAVQNATMSRGHTVSPSRTAPRRGIINDGQWVCNASGISVILTSPPFDDPADSPVCSGQSARHFAGRLSLLFRD
jgi:hypothetical protein